MASLGLRARVPRSLCTSGPRTAGEGLSFFIVPEDTPEEKHTSLLQAI